MDGQEGKTEKDSWSLQGSVADCETMSEIVSSRIYERDSHLCQETGWWLDNHFQGTLCFGKRKRIKMLMVGETRLLVLILPFFLFVLLYNFLNRHVYPYVLNLHLPL